MRIKETETRIEQEVAGLRERVEAVKFSTLQWLMYDIHSNFWVFAPMLTSSSGVFAPVPPLLFLVPTACSCSLWDLSRLCIGFGVIFSCYIRRRLTIWFFSVHIFSTRLASLSRHQLHSVFILISSMNGAMRLVDPRRLQNILFSAFIVPTRLS